MTPAPHRSTAACGVSLTVFGWLVVIIATAAFGLGDAAFAQMREGGAAMRPGALGGMPSDRMAPSGVGDRFAPGKAAGSDERSGYSSAAEVPVPTAPRPRESRPEPGCDPSEKSGSDRFGPSGDAAKLHCPERTFPSTSKGQRAK